ncbi:MAG: CRTAC1 family protein [Pseudomonadota bacterium]
MIRCLSGLLLVSVILPRASAGTIEFEDVSASVGLNFQHENGRQGDWQYPEILGGGCGLVDVNQDGWMDLILIQSGALPREREDRNPPDRDASGGSRLLIHQGTRDNGLPRFVDQTEDSGLRALGYGMGIASGDVTGNGHPDLYISNYGPNQLWRNNGDGSFTDITSESGTGDAGFGVSASITDLNGDGLLDLFLVNYVEHDPQNNPSCLASNTRRDYCGPAVFTAQKDQLFINQGEGRFENVSNAALIDNMAKPGLGVAILDMNGDQRMDVFIANDGDANQFWENLGDGRFREQGLVSGTAVNRHGQMEAGMGIAVADYNRDGLFDLFLTHLDGESNTLYQNLGDGLFVDRTAGAGLAAPSLPFTGFGTVFADFDHDGLQDLFIANGAVRVEEAQRARGADYPLQQTNLLFRNRDGRRFDNVSGSAGPAFELPAVGRGAALGDLDNDGRQDLLLCDNHGPTRLLMNRSVSDHRWLGLRLSHGEPARDAIGAVAILMDEEGQAQQQRRVATDGSYLNSQDPRVVFGLGDHEAEQLAIQVRWPDGQAEVFDALPHSTYSTLVQGEGEPWPP